MKIDKASLFATTFLVLSLITVVGITSNPLKGIAFESYARVSGTANANKAERQALREGGDKWKVAGTGKQCAGAQCYGIALGTVQSVANAKQVTTAVLADDQIQEKACTVEGGKYVNGQCYTAGQVPVATPRPTFNANDFAQVAISNADNGQIATIRALCTLANSADQCKDATFLERYALQNLNQMDTTPDKSIYNNAAQKFEANQKSISAQAQTKYTSVSANENVVSAESNYNGVLYASQNPNTNAPATGTVAIHANNANECRTAASANQYYSYNNNSHLCFLNPKNDGSAAAVITQAGTTATTTTKAECDQLGADKRVQVSYANGICTQQPVSAPPPPIQTNLGNSNGSYYLSCIQGQCPVGQRTTYSGQCACGFTSQTTAYVPPAGTSDVIVSYFDTATGKATAAELTKAQNDCEAALKLSNCDQKTLQTFTMTQLQATNPTLYQQALSQGVPAPAGTAPVAQTNPVPLPAPAPVIPGAVAPGEYAQLNFPDVMIPNTDGHTLANLGCGVIAVTNILNLNGYNYDPHEVLAMIKPQDWDNNGIGGEAGGDFLQLLTNTSNYNSSVGTNFNYGIKPANINSTNIWSRMSQGQILWIGSNAVSGTVGKNIAHITYMIPTTTPDTFKLETNDYFGSNMTCKPGQTSKGDGFKCSNDKGTTVEIPIDIENGPKNIRGGQAVYILTPPSK